jgi:outer membrane protein
MTALHRFLLGSLFVIVVSTSATGAEQSDRNPKKNPWSVQLGIGTAVSPLYTGSSIYGVSALPFLRISYNNRISFGPRGLNVRLPEVEGYELTVGLVYHPGRDEVPESDLGSIEDERLRGLGPLDGTIGTKLELSYDNLPVTVNGTIINFVGTDINGTLLSTKFSKTLPVSRRFIIVPVAGVSWASSSYTRPLYGITNGESSRTRFNRFDVGDGLNRVNLGLRNRIRLSKRWMFRAGFRIERLLGDTADSPVTREDTIVAMLSGIIYQF